MVGYQVIILKIDKRGKLSIHHPFAKKQLHDKAKNFSQETGKIEPKVMIL